MPEINGVDYEVWAVDGDVVECVAGGDLEEARQMMFRYAMEGDGLEYMLVKCERTVVEVIRG